MRMLIRGMVFLILSLALIIAMFPPLELIDYVYWALSANFNVAPEVFIMFSALLLLLAGSLLAYSLRVFLSVGASLSDFIGHLCSWLGSLNRLFNKGGLFSLGVAALLIVYWHLPPIFDASVLQFPLHLLMNVSLLLAGCLIYVGAGCLSGTTRMMAAIFGHMAMGIFGVYLLVTSSYNHFYTVYPLGQQAQLGLAMVIMMFIFEGLLVPYWLYRYFTKPIEPLSARQ